MALALVTARPAGQTRGVTSRVADVTCDVLVLDGQNVAVTGMTSGEFDVLVDGVPAQIVSASPSPTTMSVALLVDGTLSQPLRRLDIQGAVRDGWLPALVTGDHARVGIIGPSLTLGPWLPESRTTAATLALGLLERVGPEPSPIWDAIDRVATEFGQIAGPRVIILMTDGRANGNRLSMAEAAARAVAADVAISSVSEAAEAILPQATGGLERIRSDDSLRWIAEQTGGVYRADGMARRTTRAQLDPFGYVKEVSETPTKPAPLVSDIMTSMRQRHRIVFRVPADGSVHQLTVRARHPDFKTIVRRVFTSPSS
jgi:predicted Rdx family selenoprotein